MNWLPGSPLGWRDLLTLPLRHPVATFSIAIFAAIISAVLVGRLHSDASLGAMFSRDSDSARVLEKVVTDFGAVDELLVLASLPDAQKGPNPEQLLSFAQRFEKEGQRSPELSALCDGVLYRADAQTIEFFERVLVPAAVFYLDDASFAAARQRLTAPEMRRQIEQDQAMLATPGPAAGAMAKAFMQDPLRLRDFLLSRLAEQKPIRTYQGGDAFISEDGRAILIRIRGKRPPDDLKYCEALTQTAAAAAGRVNSDHLNVQFAGSYAIAATSARSIRSDMIASVTGSIICLQILFLLAYRRPIRLFIIALLPIALGVLLGFAAFSLYSTRITPLSAVLGGILAGMAIDYSIQYLSHYLSRRQTGDEPRASAQSAALIVTPAAFAAWLTSIIGFAAVGISSVKMLRDFSLLGSIGLAGAFLAVVALLPTLLFLADRKKRFQEPFLGVSGFRGGFVGVIRFIDRRRAACFVVCALLVIAAVAMLARRGELLAVESDLAVMHPRPNPPLEAQAQLSHQFGIAPDSLIVHLHADSPEQLVTLAHEVDRRLKSEEGHAAGIVATYGLATLLPDPAVVPSRLAMIGQPEAQRVVTDFKQIISDAGFNSDAAPLENYANFLRVLLTQSAAPSIEKLLPYRRLAETMLPRSAFSGQRVTEAMTIVFFREQFVDRASRDRAVLGVRHVLASVSGATPTGLSVISYDTERAVRHDLPRLVWLAVIAIALYLAIHFRSLSESLLAMLPTAFSLILLAAIAHLAGQKLNMVNLVAIPLLIGIDVDYGVFLVSLARLKQTRAMTRDELIARLAPVCHAVVVCALATMIGFGSLAWTSVPAIRSLGFAVAVGIGACLFAALFLVVPIFLTLAKPSEGRMNGTKEQWSPIDAL